MLNLVVVTNLRRELQTKEEITMVPGKITTRRILSGIGVAVTVAAAVLMSSCGDKDTPKEKPVVVRPVKTMTIGAAAGESQRSFPGKVKASQEVDLAFEVSGRIVELPVKEGEAVEKDQVLARLDPTDFENNVAKKKARFENAEANLGRAKRLIESGSISRSEYDNRRTVYDSAEADLKIAQKALQDTYLKAPFSGLVAKKFVDNYKNVTAKQKIMSLQDVSHIEIVVNVPEDLIAWAKGRGPERIVATFESVPGEEFDVTVKEYGTTANKQTQTFPVTVVMPAPKHVNILPGMTATITAEGVTPTGTAADRFTIPVSAVFADENGKPNVWVVDKASMTARKRAIKTGNLTGESITVLDGLKPGDMIITAGVDFVKDKMKVRLLDGKTGAQK